MMATHCNDLREIKEYQRRRRNGQKVGGSFWIVMSIMAAAAILGLVLAVNAGPRGAGGISAEGAAFFQEEIAGVYGLVDGQRMLIAMAYSKPVLTIGDTPHELKLLSYRAKDKTVDATIDGIPVVFSRQGGWLVIQRADDKQFGQRLRRVSVYDVAGAGR